MRAILEILERDARVDPANIATMTGLDEADVRVKIEEWERSGVIRHYKTVIDWERYGEESVEAFIDVSVAPERGAGFDDVAARIYRYPEVRSVYLVSGGHDLRVVVRGSGMKEVARFVADKLSTLDRVSATNTHFLLKRYKQDGDVFDEKLEDHRLMVTP
jgi:DNA-binding Lrp family transcriptional regulator